jgi:hypothetical protein
VTTLKNKAVSAANKVALSYVDSENHEDDIKTALKNAAQDAVDTQLQTDEKSGAATVVVEKVSFSVAAENSTNAYQYKVSVTYGGETATSGNQSVNVTDLFNSTEAQKAVKNAIEAVETAAYASVSAAKTAASNAAAAISGVTVTEVNATAATTGKSFDVTVSFTYNEVALEVTATLAGSLS